LESAHQHDQKYRIKCGPAIYRVDCSELNLIFGNARCRFRNQIYRRKLPNEAKFFMGFEVHHEPSVDIHRPFDRMSDLNDLKMGGSP
jgi:hypothetical protein